jgi:hypothetical protein
MAEMSTRRCVKSRETATAIELVSCGPSSEVNGLIINVDSEIIRS